MYNKINGENSIIIYDGDKAVLYSVQGKEHGYTFEERIQDYIDTTYWYLPKLDRRKVILNHGISSAQVVNNFVFFETIVPNRNYYKQIQKCREQFLTSILINNPDGFLTLGPEEIEEILEKKSSIRGGGN